MSGGETTSLRERPWFWAVQFWIAVAAISALRLTGAIDGPTGFILLAGSMGLLIPMTRAILRKQRRTGSGSAAGVTYMRRMMLVSMAYVLGLGTAITLHERMELAGAAGFAIAMLPVIPIFGMIWAMGRYLADEKDEYLRYRAVKASLMGLGAVLAIGSFWGFLETFGMVPHVPGWWAVPIWAMSMGLAQCWMSLRDKAGEVE